MQEITILSGGKENLRLYETVSIAYTVESQISITPKEKGLLGFDFTEEKLARPYQKDYEALGGPGDWARFFDISNWEIALLYVGELPAGGVAVAWNTDGVNMLEERRDLAVIWDLRVAPAFRQRGLGTRLFSHAEKWARGKGCRLLKVETQNTNAPACRFYAAMGCHLEGMNFHAYDGVEKVKGDVQFLWYKEIGRQR